MCYDGIMENLTVRKVIWVVNSEHDLLSYYVYPKVKLPFTVILRITDGSVCFVAVVAKARFVFALSRKKNSSM